MSVVLGYGRRAYGQQACTQSTDTLVICDTSAGPVNFATGAPTAPLGWDYTFSPAPGATSITITLAPTTILTTEALDPAEGFLAGDLIRITGDSDLALNASQSAYLFSSTGAAVVIGNDNAGNPGNIRVTTDFQPGEPDEGVNWGFTGYTSAIAARNDANGVIDLTLNNRLAGHDAGVVAVHGGTGDITITHGNPSPGVADGGITATGTGPDHHGLVAEHLGTGSIAITVNGDITAAGGHAVSATTGTTGTGIGLTLGDGTLSGMLHGLHAYSAGGSILVDAGAATGLITGRTGNGINVHASAEATGNLTIRTGAGLGPGLATPAQDSAAVIGATHGISALNLGSAFGAGLVRVQTGEGSVTGTTADGISLTNDGGSGIDIETGSGSILGGGNGIKIDNRTGYVWIDTYDGAITGQNAGLRVDNYGMGDVNITTRASAVTGLTGHGIEVDDTNNGSVIITTGAGDAAGLAIAGSLDGIHVGNTTYGSINITVAGGDITGTNGDGIDVFNDINTSNIAITLGGAANVKGGANGILARTYSTHGITIDASAATGTVEGGSGDGIYAYNRYAAMYGITITTGTGDGTEAVLGGSYGIKARNMGAGSVTVTTGDGAITGTSADGIRAYGGDLGYEVTVITGTGDVTGGVGGINAQNLGYGALKITTNAAVHGSSGTGIKALNGQTPLGEGAGADLMIEANGTVTGAESAILARNITAGVLSMDLQGEDVTGTDFGVQTYQYGTAATTITISAETTVQGGTAAVFAAGGSGGAIGISNAGVLQNLSGLASDLVVDTGNGATTLQNTHLMTGRIGFGDRADTVINSGTWTTGGSSTFGLGEDGLSNANLLVAATRAGVAEETRLLDLESFTNTGTIDLGDETAGNGATSFDTLVVSGSFNGGGGTLRLDAFLGEAGSQSDRLIIGGTATGSTGIDILDTGNGIGGDGAAILLVDTGGATGSEFFLSNGPIRLGAYVYDLIFNGQDFFLQSARQALQLDAAAFPAVLGDLWDITASGWHRNTVKPRVEGGAAVSRMATNPGVPLSGGSGAVGWGRLIVDQRHGGGTITPDGGGAATAVNTSFDQSTLAFIGGVDVTLGPDANGGALTFGALIGVIDSTVDFDLTGDRAVFSGPTYGIHIAYATDLLRADLIVKRDDLDLEYRVAGLSEAPGRADAVSTGASLEVGVKVRETTAMVIEAVGNLSHVSTRIDSFTIGATDFGFEDADTTRGAIGLVLRGNHAFGATWVKPTLTVKYWNVFDSGASSVIDAVAFGHDGTGGYVEAAAGLEFADPDSGWSGFLAGSGIIGANRNGARAELGLNLEW